MTTVAAPMSISFSAPEDPAWAWRYIATDPEGRVVGAVLLRLALVGDLSHTYPAGLSDRQVQLDSHTSAPAFAAVVSMILADNPRCRRIVYAVAAGDLPAIALAELAGFRYVVDVDTTDRDVSLLVAEPEWVLVQPSAIEDIPL